MPADTTTNAKPHHHARAALLSVGDELVLGQTLDTNSRWLADRLASMGILTAEHATVADDADAQTAALVRLAGAHDVVIVTGGLGPTADDLTRVSLARASGDTLVEDPVAFAQIEAFFAARGRTLTPLNRTQALRPARGATMSNHFGTAPGLIARVGSCDVFCLPGPPREMHPMFEQSVVPRLKPAADRTIRTRVLHTFGIGESDLAQRLGKLMDRAANPLVGTTASRGVVSCRLRYEGPATQLEAQRLLDQTEAQVREAGSPFVFGAGSDTLPSVTLQALRERGQSLSLAESCTGGLLGAMLTEIPGSSAVLWGGVVSYANEIKQRALGVPAECFAPGGPGAVSSETALAMARGVLERLGTHHALSITGIAGPGGATDGKPVGTVFIARASADGTHEARRFLISSDRATIRELAALSALMILWQHVTQGRATPLMRQVPIG
jgi:nicotinamide-nucleotide amidase